MASKGLFGIGMEGSVAPYDLQSMGMAPPAHDEFGHRASSPTYPPQSFSMHARNAHGSGGGNDKDWQEAKQYRTSALLDVNDPVAMHLLRETAFADSKGFELLSYSELENLKAEKATLHTRIESVKQKLALETKVRDAAQSMNRLYTKSSTEPSNFRIQLQRRSLSGNRNSVGSIKADSLGRSQSEFEASARMCEELSTELRHLEARAGAVQQRILQHTAGVLQFSLETAIRDAQNTNAESQLRRIAPTTFYDDSQVDEGYDVFDYRSLYKLADNLDSFNGYAAPQQSDSVRNVDTRQEEFQIIQDRVESLNAKIRDVVIKENPHLTTSYPWAPNTSQDGSEASQNQTIGMQLDYLDNCIRDVEVMHAETCDELRQRSSQYENTTAGLWEILISGEEEARRQRQERRQLFAANPELEDGEQGVVDQDLASSDEFSLPNFSAKVQSLYRRAISLEEQHTILRRQIDQQRRLNSTSDADKNAQVAALTAKLEAADRLQDDIHAREERIAALTAKLEAAERLHDDIHAREERIADLESELSAAKDDARIAAIEAAENLRMTKQAGDSSRAQVDALEKQLAAKEEEVRHLEGEVVRLQTDVTVARAELDAAYGSRAERAAQVAADPAVQQQLAEVGKLRTEKEQAVARAAQLKEELQDLLAELEELTKASVDTEREREGLENVIDGLRDRCEALETRFAEERIRSLGSKSPINGLGSESPQLDQEKTSTTVLKHEFKKLMREARAESVKSLRAEQEERRRLEALVRSLRRDQAQIKGRVNAGSKA